MLPALDTLAGALLAVMGLLGWRRYRRTSLFALGASAAWFAAPVMPIMILLHRPLLLHAILALPRRGAHGPFSGALLALAWVSVVLPAGMQPWISVATAALCLVVAAELSTPLTTSLGPDVVAARRALVLMSVGLALPSLERLAWPGYIESGLPLATYLGAVSLCCVAMIWGILAFERHEDAVIELAGNTPAGALDRLRRLAEDEPDPARVRALGSAIFLLEDNARLQRDLAARIEDVRASRARLVRAGIDERQRLERILADGAMRYLDELEDVLRRAGRGQHDEIVAECLDEVDRTREDLQQLARGLHPRMLAEHGLAAALEELSRHAPVPVEVRAPPGRYPEATETSIWYACAEALANVWKHARATAAVVSVTVTRDALRATVHDDGVGGASVTPGGGLAGLVDRLTVVDGSLTLSTTPAGTDVTVEVPLR